MGGQGIDDPTDFHEDLWTVLANSRRRMLIRLLQQHSGFSPRDAAQYISMAELDSTDPDEITTEKEHATYVSLQQSHLQPLRNLQIIAVEETTDAITQGTNYQLAWEILNYADGVR